MEPCGGCQRSGTEERSKDSDNTTTTTSNRNRNRRRWGPKETHEAMLPPLAAPLPPTSPSLEHPAAAYDTTCHRQKACRALLIRPSPRQAQGPSIDTNKRFAPRVLLLTHHNTSNLVTCHGWWWERLRLASISVTCSGVGGRRGLSGV